jgi:biotin synthase
MPLTFTEILTWLREQDSQRLDQLWQAADRLRQRYVGDEVHLRGLVEISNFCTSRCAYCGLRVANTALTRYRLSNDEVMACVRQAVDFGYGTVVLQAGEDPGLTREWVAGLVRRIKTETPLAVTLSLGERSEQELLAWRAAGADRYLLRFETSNRQLYDRIHPSPPGRVSDRLGLLPRLREMGYEIGSGVMIGIPGQSYEDLARDVQWFGDLDLDMIGVGPFLPHPATPLGDPSLATAADDQVPGSEVMTYKMIALARLVCPRANIPSTTALATLNRLSGRELGLARGANVVMPNLTPPEYRALYEIYPDKACVRETGDACHTCLGVRIAAIGRRIGQGRGDSPNLREKGTGPFSPERPVGCFAKS